MSLANSPVWLVSHRQTTANEMGKVIPIFYLKEMKLLSLYFSGNCLFDLPTICVAQILKGQFLRLFIYRERERERRKLSLQRPFKLLLSPRRQATHSPARPLIACITTRWRKKTTAKDAAEVVREACRIAS